MKLLSGRTFGVEIECGNQGFDCIDMRGKLRRGGFEGYDVGRDGSGIEVKTPILKGEKGYRALTEVMYFLNKLGCFVTRSDGMHVHVGAAFLQDDTPAAKRLAALWIRNQGLISRMCSSHRLRAGAYNPPLNEAAVVRVGYCSAFCDNRTSCNNRHHRDYKQWPGRFSLNFEALTEHGTIEFRTHEGCLDPVKAVAWVQFCQKFIDYIAEGNEVVTWRSRSAMLRALGVPQDAISTLKKKQPEMPAHPTRVFAPTRVA